MKLWRYNAITGYWQFVRSVGEEGLQWLAIFQQDEPQAVFKLSKKRPQ